MRPRLARPHVLPAATAPAGGVCSGAVTPPEGSHAPERLPAEGRGRRRRTMGTVARALLAAAPLLAVAACETGPAERRVRAEFACEDARRLRVTYFQDRGTAELRLSRKEAAEIPAIPGVPGRAYAGAGWEMRGIGDSVTLTSPGAAPTRCTETR